MKMMTQLEAIKSVRKPCPPPTRIERPNRGAVIVAKANGIAMKTNYSDMAKRYKLAEEMTWAKLENWQKLAITQDRAAKKTSTVFDSFTKQVIALAESLTFAPKGAIPPSKPLKKSLTSTRN